MMRYEGLNDVCVRSPVSLVFGIPTQDHPCVNVPPLCRLGLNEAVWVGYPVLVIMSFSRHGHSFWMNLRWD